MRAKSAAPRSGVSLRAEAVPWGTRGETELELIVTGMDGGNLVDDWNQEELRISSKLGRDLGSVRKILEIRSLACCETLTVSGKVYWLMRIRLYVVFTSEVSNGGRPMIIV